MASSRLPCGQGNVTISIMRKSLIAAVLLTLVLALPVHAHAWGLGMFYSGGKGHSDLLPAKAPERDYALEVTGWGLSWDTNIGKDETFNYRLSLGTGEYGEKGKPWEGLSLTHDFGFGIARNRMARLWLGPEIMLTFIDDDSIEESPRLFGFGMGPVVGANLNITGHLAFSLRAAYIYETLSGEMTMGGVRQDVTSEDEFSYISVSLMLRLDERF